MPEGYDDLGQWGGCYYLPQAGLAQRSVLDWTPIAVGNRPRDHMARDLLFGSAYRDGRLVLYHKACKNRPAWALEDIESYLAPKCDMILRQRLLHFFHLAKLFEFSGDADPETAAILERLSRCWPMGVAVQWSGDGERGPRDICRHAPVCPWCLCRTVLDVDERLRRGPLRDASEKCLVLGALSQDCALPESSDEASTLFGSAKRRLHDLLQNAAAELGCEGGIVVFQVGPRKARNGEREGGGGGILGYRLRAAILGDVTRPGRLLAANGASPIDDALLEREGLHGQWTVRSGTQALRILLAGTSPSYRGNTVPGGHPGAFTMAPWFLAEKFQWFQHYYAIASTRLYSAWGTWLGQMETEPRGRARRPPFVNANQRRGADRRTVAFRESNRQRRQDASDRRGAMKDQVRPHWETLAAELGRPPGRQQLRMHLRGIGVDLSERDVRWLVDELRAGEPELVE